MEKKQRAFKINTYEWVKYLFALLVWSYDTLLLMFWWDEIQEILFFIA